MQQVFPGSSPFIETAAAELGLDVRVHEVQKLPALRVVAVLASQAGTHPRPAELVEAAAPHLAALAVASKAATAMVDSIVPKPVPTESTSKPAASTAAKTAAPTPTPTPIQPPTDPKTTASAAVDAESKTRPRK